MNAPVGLATTSIQAVAQGSRLGLHVAIFLGPNQTLGDEHLRLVSFNGEESVSQPFEFELELHGDTADRKLASLRFDDVIGRPVTVGICLPSAGASPGLGQDKRFAQALAGHNVDGLSLFNGIVASFGVERPGVYRITMRPTLWKLQLTNDYRIHPQGSIKEVLAALMQRHGISASFEGLSGSDNPAVIRRQAWLQAGETDDEFMQRLMSKAHVYYFFEHSAHGHRVVFANRPAYPYALPEGRPLRYCATEDELGLRQFDVLTRYSLHKSLTSESVRAQITREEAATESDAIAGFHIFSTPKPPPGAELLFRQVQVWQYGGSKAEADYYADATQSALRGAAVALSGGSHCAWLRSGSRFDLTAQPRGLQQPTQVRPELEGRSFVLTRVKHDATLDGSYSNEFNATEANAIVASVSLHDTQQGSVIGRVASAAVQAPSDWRYARPGCCDPENLNLTDTDSSDSPLSAKGLMVQLSTDDVGQPLVWVKLAASMQTVPEIGATVVIARAQDQSELPEIQSIVQSNVSQTVMPSGWTAHTSIGSNFSTNWGDSKSIRMGLDDAASFDTARDQVETQYATGLYRDVSYARGSSYSYSSAEQGAAGLLNRSESYGSTYSKQRGAVSSSDSEFAASDSTSVVTGTARNTTRHAVTINESAIGEQVDLGVVGTTQRINATGDSRSVSAVINSVDLSTVGNSSSLSIKGASSSIELTGAGLRADIAALRVTIDIPLISITL